MYWQVGLFAAMLSAAGIPLYIHLPQFASAELGLSLATTGSILIAIRMIDFIQDPLLGKLVDRWSRHRSSLAALGVGGLAVGFLMLFSVPPQTGKVLWLSASLVLVFTSFSLASILFYAEGVRLAGTDGSAAHYNLAGWRETGTLLGVVLAASLPTVIDALGREATTYRDFGVVLAILAVLAGLLTRGIWSTRDVAAPKPIAMRTLLQGRVPRLLVLALVNALPVAITSTLFLFFVEDHLKLPSLAGPFLLMFFLAAGGTAPFWSRLAQTYAVRVVLVSAMILAIAAFIGAGWIGEGSVLAFAVICLASGAALGADMVILPALFASLLARDGLSEGTGFGLWSFAQKMALAIAAALVLPGLDLFGFQPGGTNDTEALSALVTAYAIVPCILKILAILLVLTLPKGAIAR